MEPFCCLPGVSLCLAALPSRRSVPALDRRLTFLSGTFFFSDLLVLFCPCPLGFCLSWSSDTWLSLNAAFFCVLLLCLLVCLSSFYVPIFPGVQCGLFGFDFFSKYLLFYSFNF